MKKIIKLLAVLIVLVIIYLLIWPVSIDPVAWTPPEAPALEGQYAANDYLKDVERIGVGMGIGPEDVAIDDKGRIYGGYEDGRIIRFQNDGSNPEIFADTQGRPLGMHFDANGNLIVADSQKGLLSISPEGVIKVLTTQAAGLPFGFTDDVDVAADGVIYFSDASYKFGQLNYTADLLEHRPNGRLLSFDPETKITKVILDSLYFANGVAVSPDQSFVLVNETGKYRITRYWLSGPDQGKSELFIENLPGFPDGISSDEKETFWLAIASPRKPELDALMPKPFIRKIIMRLPGFLQPAPVYHSFVLGLNLQGDVIHNLQDASSDCYRVTTSVQEHDGMLYIGSLEEDSIARIAVPGN